VQIAVDDAEEDIISVRICSGKKYNADKKFMGKVDFPLRGSVRDFESPNYQYKWYDLSGPGITGGKIRIFIEYVDTRQSEGPKNVKHESHVGLSADGSFDIRNIPVEWKKAFKHAGIKKSDLQDPKIRTVVFGIMNDHDQQRGGKHGVSGLPPPPPPINGGVSFNPDLPPPPLAGIPRPIGEEGPLINASAPPPPPPPGLVKSKGAPPPLPNGPPPNSSGKVPPPPPPKKGPGLLDQIKGMQLRDSTTAPPVAAAPQKEDLTTTLLEAINLHRTAVKDSDDEEQESDWTTEDNEE